MGNNSKVALIVLNYNDYPTTSSFLERIKEFGLLDKIVVVDNHSSDESYRLLKAYENEKIEVIQTPYNGGYGYGNNYGIRYAYELYEPDFMIISNPDVIFEEHIIKRMIFEIEKDEKYSCIAPMMRDINGNLVQGTAWRVPNALQYTLASGVLINKFFTLNKYRELKAGDSPNTIPVECLAGSFFMVKSKDMIEFGLYDESMFLYCEETYLGIQMKKNNKKMLLLTDEFFIHAHGISINKTYKSAIKKQWMVWKNKELILRKHMDCSNLQVTLAHIFFCVCTIEQYLLSAFSKKA